MKAFAVGETIIWSIPTNQAGGAPSIALANPDNNYYLDFADGVLKVSGWTLKRKTMVPSGERWKASWNTTGLPAGSQGIGLVEEWILDGDTLDGDIVTIRAASGGGGASLAEIESSTVLLKKTEGSPTNQVLVAADHQVGLALAEIEASEVLLKKTADSNTNQVGIGATHAISAAGITDLAAALAALLNRIQGTLLEGDHHPQSGDAYSKIPNLTVTTGNVVADAFNSATQFKTDLGQAAEHHWKDSWITFSAGDLAGQTKRITGYNGSTKTITVSGGFTGTPAAAPFVIINR